MHIVNKRDVPSLLNITRISFSSFLILLLIGSGPLHCEELSMVIDSRMEKLEENLNYDSLLLEFLRFNPINLNTAHIRDLVILPSIDRSLAKKILQLRDRLGNFKNVIDLLELSEISEYDFAIIRQFVTTGLASEIGINFQIDNYSLQSINDTVERNQVQNQLQSFVRLQSHWFKSYFDIVASRRTRNKVHFDSSSGMVSSSQDENIYYVERVSAYNLHNPVVLWALGDYQLGFAQGLTFNNSYRKNPKGIYSNSFYLINSTAGKIKKVPSLFGAALERSFNIHSNQFSVTLFASYKKNDLRQKEFVYGPDEWLEPVLGSCIEVGQSTGPFTCDMNGEWVTSFVDHEDFNNSNALLLRNVFTESLFGQHVAWKKGNFKLGLIHYNGNTDFLIAAPNVHFSLLSPYPIEKYFYATGMYVEHSKYLDFSSELTFTQQSGLAWLMRSYKSINSNWNTEVFARYYNPHYKNPHSQGEISNIQGNNVIRNNEQGIRMTIIGKMGHVKKTSFLDIWQNPFEPSEPDFIKLKNPNLNILLQQQWIIGFRKHSYVGLLWGWTDIESVKDVSKITADENAIKRERIKLQVKYLYSSFQTQFEFGYLSLLQKEKDLKNRRDFTYLLYASFGFRHTSIFRSTLSLTYRPKQLPGVENDYIMNQKPYVNLFWRGDFSLDRNWNGFVHFEYLSFKPHNGNGFDTYLSVTVNLAYSYSLN